MFRCILHLPHTSADSYDFASLPTIIECFISAFLSRELFQHKRFRAGLQTPFRLKGTDLLCEQNRVNGRRGSKCGRKAEEEKEKMISGKVKISASGGSVGERAGARFIRKCPKRFQRASGGSKRAVAQSERWLRASGGSGRAVARNGVRGFRSHCGEGGWEKFCSQSKSVPFSRNEVCRPALNLLCWKAHAIERR